ncbi:MAG: carbonic anhydrase [Gammaproteobacteria bacterium]|nr:carbonic anhydrase [Gammaproteobacteria bacterium]
MIPAREALERLREGNRRFVSGNLNREILSSPSRRHALVKDQQPYAIILGCSDSRVPAELVFDQGLGHLFVIRVAGNIVAPSQIGSIEYAAERFGSRLVVVLGHSNCGAVEATLEELQQPSENRSPNLRSIVGRIRPSVEDLLDEGGEISQQTMERAVRANIDASVEQLRHGSEILEQLIRDEGLLIVGAQYCLEQGVVEFFDHLE